ADNFDKLAVMGYLQNNLPEYMVPAIWVQLDKLPLTQNGKVDKKALPEPEIGDFQTQEYVAPSTEMAQKLVKIWQELLNVNKIGIHDNFFELGGHSLIAMRVIAYIERDLSVAIPINILFQLTTISELSKYLELQVNSKQKTMGAFKVLDV
ncbi:MAG: hypothetical protein H7Y07_06700, partial [Pyrinomonadaceae bacterium]|nr:hypothetical protein [Sphingobacteriaceae bacterium]